MEKYKRIITYAAPPLAVLALLLYAFSKSGLYPFGDGAVAWCDLRQQSVPLLMDLKDILSGKDSLFFNMHNAGGMSLYGVFFFFLSSPINLLVAFVEKENIMLFANILIIIKLCISALTMQIYLRHCHKGLGAPEGILLSVSYALCGYGMLFYQNQMWLDVMYLFPLLVYALEVLIRKENNLPFIAAFSAIVFCNYYLSFMTALFVALFVGIYALSDSCSDRALAKLVSGTGISLAITSFVWLPSLVQVMSSGRGEPILEGIGKSRFLSSYETSVPILLCTAGMFVVVMIGLFSRREKTREEKKSLIMFAAMLVPVFIEPVNLMWHTGNYMSFPVRYGFITIFCGLRCTAYYLSLDRSLDSKKDTDVTRSMFGAVLCAICVFFYLKYIPQFIENHFSDLTRYTSTLWGNKQSLDRLSEIFIISMICYLVIYLLRRKSIIPRQVFLIFAAVLVAAESVSNIKLYMSAPYINNRTDNAAFTKITDLSDRINDDSFYRVITEGKITDYNMIGALGYNSLSHYTSLTDKDFMTLQKRLGYTTVWMEVGSAGGSDFTNALYCAKYKIVKGKPTEKSIYSNGTFSIEPQTYSFGLGLILDNDLSGCEYLPEGAGRAEVQRFMFKALTGKDPITEYQPEDTSLITKTYSGLSVKTGKPLTYKIKVTNTQTLYADCSGAISNNLSEDYFEGFTVYVNGQKFRDSYPKNTDNGLLELGRFSNETVEVELSCKKNVTAPSIGVFGFDEAMLREAVETIPSVGFEFTGSKLTGSYNGEAKTCLLSVPYSEGFTLSIDGSSVPYRRLFSDMIAFELPAGEHEIELTHRPPAVAFAIVISILGAACLAAYWKLLSKKQLPKKAYTAAGWAVKFGALIAGVAVYIYPIVINLMYIPE